MARAMWPAYHEGVVVGSGKCWRGVKVDEDEDEDADDGPVSLEDGAASDSLSDDCEAWCGSKMVSALRSGVCVVSVRLCIDGPGR